MKNFTLSLVFAISQIFLFAQCPPGDLLIFSSQAQVDDFAISYPNCTELNADVVITGGIINLYGLNNLTSIGGNLQFLYNSALSNAIGLENLTEIGGSFSLIENYFMVSLVGLNNLTTVGGDLILHKNNVLLTTNAFSSLESVGGALVIDTNPKLNSLSGLANLNTIGSNCEISNNPLLTEVIGMESVSSIGGTFYIYNNEVLSSLDGLSGLESIGGELEIKTNVELTSLSGLMALTSIGGALTIQSNYELSSLSGLDNIDASSIVDLKVYSNTSLSSCEVLSICNYLASPGASILIDNNATGCASQQEVEDACVWVSVDEMDQDEALSIYPNPASSTITIETSATPNNNTFMTLNNLSGQQMIRQQMTEQQTTINILDLPQGIYFVKVSNERMVEVQKIIKQ